MIRLTNEELKDVVGGLNISGTIINSFVRAIEISLELGRSFGTSIRRIIGSGICSIR